MASEGERDDPFQRILHQIGGKSNIHLISALSRPDGDTGVLQDFIADMFNNGEHEEITDCIGNRNGEIKIQTNVCSPDQSHADRSGQSSSTPADSCTKSEKPDPLKNKTVSSSRNIGGKQRAIKCSVIIFIFRHDYLCNKENYVCLREILKDVRARLKINALPPALLGLVHTDCDQSESRESVELLDRSMRSVFINHPQQAIWTGRYVTKSPDLLQEIRCNACRAVKSSMSAESGTGSKSSLFWSLKCLPGIFRKGHRGQADFNTNSLQQANPNTGEEGIPLQTQTTAQ
ncbi:uncharacterized protein LOC125254965 isoform X1 [Megalobrama amblycephala]|uniref:uncharacterized protein LOC125254965 isoform X1 n=1 Tax=Megalobrama amblycephala TaxID=75352 RepID=UPI002013F9E2|nr:uncharacterized protein LOC125254965 isoform X1 [Megalobrama amblycephala]